MENISLRFISLIIMLFSGFSTNAQVIQINQTFSGDTVFAPFSGSTPVYSLSMSGSVNLYSDSSLVRVILIDVYGNHHLVFETYPLIAFENAFDTLYACDETKYLNGILCDSLQIDIISAFLDLDSLILDTNSISGVNQLQAQTKWISDSLKIDIMNQRIAEEHMYWRAGRTSISNLFYFSKEMSFGRGYNFEGYDFYKGGIFRKNSDKTAEYDNSTVTDEFDWRDRHGASDETSPYYNSVGVGWFTPAKNQNIYEPDHLYTKLCYVFSPVASVEARHNLIYNIHPDYPNIDISEMDIWRCYAGCLPYYSPDFQANSFNRLQQAGFRVDEDCFPFNYNNVSQNAPCSWKCTDFDHQLCRIDGFECYPDANHSMDQLKEYLIEKGPLSIFLMNYPISQVNHYMVLSGFSMVKEGDIVYKGENENDPDIVIEPGSPIINYRYWIFKNSYGTTLTEDGFEKIQHTHTFWSKIKPQDIKYPTGLVNWYGHNTSEMNCTDEDGDGYFWWGVNLSPEQCNCSHSFNSNERDCDDNDIYSGPYATLEYNPDNQLLYSCTPNCNYDPNNPEIIYFTPTNPWETDLHFNRDLIIKNGATVTVLGATIWMGPSTKIIIERGGQLILAPKNVGGIVFYPKITAGCGEFWEGIEVWGNSNENQAGNQGILQLDHATIEKMRFGIRNFRPDWNVESGMATYPGYSGGIIKTTNSTFRDNKKSIVFAPYTTDDCASYCIADIFETNGLLLDDSYAQYFVVINSTRGNDFRFTNCTFRENGPDKMKTIGIYAYNSEFKVDGGNQDPLNPIQENFFGLNYGIYAFGNGYNPDYQIQITNSWFESNRRGIYLSGIAEERIRNNVFRIPSIDEDTCYGLYLDHSTQWNMITENVFQKPVMGQRGQIGIYVNYCGGDPKQIYKNTFQYLDYGTIAFGINRDDEGEGLVYKCNSFSDCVNDIVVLGEPDYPEGGINETRMGIAYHQGTLTNPAGNTFTEPNTCEFNIFNDAQNSIRYVVPSDWVNYPEFFPFDINDPVKVYVETGLVYTSELSCDPLGSDLVRDSLYETKQVLNEEIESLILELNLLIDGGNTTALNTTVITSIPQQALQVYDELMLKSPNLSDSVMNSSILKEEVLNNAFLRDILAANPQAAKRDSLMVKLDERLVPMPDTMKAEIMEGIQFLSSKEILEAAIQEKHSMERDIFGKLIFSLCQDSLVMDPLDSLMVLFINDASLSSKYQLAFAFLKSEEISGVDSLLTGIPSAFSLDNSEQEIHQGYLDIFNVLTQLDSANIYHWYLNSAHELMLEELAQNDTILPGVLARNLLQAAGKLSWLEKIVLPFDSLKSISAEEQINEQTETKYKDAHWVKVYPNPARDYYIVEYMFPPSGDSESPPRKEIEIFTQAGTRIIKIPVSHHYDQVIVRCESYSNGSYICSLKDKGKTVSSTLFIIAR